MPLQRHSATVQTAGTLPRSAIERRPPCTLKPPPPTRTPPSHCCACSRNTPSTRSASSRRALGVSLGKTHYLLKALLAKGWVKAQNFQRSDRKLGYLYVLTPAGIRQRLQLTQAFLARKEREYVALRSQISALRKDLADQGGPRP